MRRIVTVMDGNRLHPLPILSRGQIRTDAALSQHVHVLPFVWLAEYGKRLPGPRVGGSGQPLGSRCGFRGGVTFIYLLEARPSDLPRSPGPIFGRDTSWRRQRMASVLVGDDDLTMPASLAGLSLFAVLLVAAH